MENVKAWLSTEREMRLRPTEDFEDAEMLAASLRRAVQQETDGAIADLVVEVGPHGVRLSGRCDTFYTKQLAQHAVMRIHSEGRLINNIQVL